MGARNISEERINAVVSDILEGLDISAVIGEASNLPYTLKPSKFGFEYKPEENFSDDGNVFRVFRYKGDGPRLSRFISGHQGGRRGIVDTGEFLSLDVEDYVAGNKYNNGTTFKSQAEADAALKYLAQVAAKEYDDGDSGFDEPDVVEIVKDSGRLRGVADDGEHGRGFVNMPKNLRTKVGVKYRVSDLKWNGRNYVARHFTNMDGSEVAV